MQVYERGETVLTRIDAPVVVIFSPLESQIIMPDDPSLCVRFWVHCFGRGVENLLKTNGLLGSRYARLKGRADELSRLIFDIYEEMLYKGYNYNLACTANLLKIVALVSRGKANSEQNGHFHFNQIIAPALQHMHKNLHTELCGLDYANLCHVSEYHFIRLFKTCTGLTPHAYITAVRIAQAKLLLTCSNSSISTVGAAVGYADPSYFSYVFKRSEGVSPNDYRCQKKTE